MFTQMRSNLKFLSSVVFAVTFLVGGFFVANLVKAEPASTIVSSANMNGWYFWNDKNDTFAGSPGKLVSGPTTAPLGTGSVELGPLTDNGSTAAGHSAIATDAYEGTSLSSITNFSYSTYQPGPTLAIALQFDVKYRTADTAYGGRLVFEPYQNGAVTVGSDWQSWSPLAGKWWASKTAPAGTGGVQIVALPSGNCDMSSPCTWGQIKAAFPDATISGRVLLKAGGNWNGFDGNADALTIGVSGDDTTFDFEPNIVTNNENEVYSTIQDAINGTNPDGTINVADGIYDLTSRIDVNKAVSIIGDVTTPANVVINAPTGGTLQGQNSVFIITSSNVTIQGFRIQGALHTGAVQNAGIYVDDPNLLSHPGLTNITISNNEITNNGYGVVVQNIKNSTISNNKVFSNKKAAGTNIYKESGVGIVVFGRAEDSNHTHTLTIDNNQVYSNETEGIRIDVESKVGATTFVNDVAIGITNNTVYNNGSTISDVDKYVGIKSAGWSKGVTVSGNEIYGHTGTTISPTSGNAGISIAASNSWAINNNNIHDNLNGIFFAYSTFDSGSGSHTISNNNIHANVRGISIDDGTEAVANNKNSIYSNDSTTFSVIGFAPYNVYNSGSGTFDTTNNWWGSSVLSDIQAKVFGLVELDFTPWYINPGRTILSTAISSGGEGGGTITVTTPTIDFAEISDGAVDLGVSNLALGNESVLDLADSTNSITTDGEDPEEGIFIAGTFEPLSIFITGEMLEPVNLTQTLDIGGEDVLVEQAIQLSSGTPGTPTVLTNTSLSNVSVSIPDDTTILAPKGWDGTIAPPTDIPSDDGTAPSGFSVGDTVIEVGSPDVILLFDKAVKITLTGVTGTVGYKPAGSDTWKTITTQCTSEDDHSNIAFPGECYFPDGGNTIIWTYHFTSFGEFIPDPTPSHGSSGGYLKPVTPAVPANVTTPDGCEAGNKFSTTTGRNCNAATPAVGKVLGAEKFNFTKFLKFNAGSYKFSLQGAEVIELQKLLTSLGYDLGTADGKFGPKTKGAVIKFQITNSLKGDGVVGPLTRAVLNK